GNLTYAEVQLHQDPLRTAAGSTIIAEGLPQPEAPAMFETSASLLERLRDRADAGAWQRLMDLYTPLTRSWLGRYALQYADRDDLRQDVLAVRVRELPAFQHSQQRGAFRHWLRMITVNRLRAFWRTQQFRPTAAGGSDLMGIFEQLEDPDSALSRSWDEEHDQHAARRRLEMI